MQGIHAQRHLFTSFLRKLAAALPANLVVFWLVLHNDLPGILLYSSLGALLGVLLLMAVEGRGLQDEIQPEVQAKPTHRATVHEFPRHPRHA